MVRPEALAKRAVLCLALALLSACADGYRSPAEQALESRAAGAVPVTAGTGTDARAAVRRALLSDPDIRSQASLIAAGSDQIRVERAAKFPGLRVSGGAGTGSAGSGDPSVTVTGEQVLWDFGAADRAVRMADVELQVRYQRFQMAVDTVIAEALAAYAEVAARSEIEAIRRRQQEAVAGLSALIGQRVDIGAIALQDQLEVSSRAERADYEVLDAGFQLEEARDRLSRLTGSTRGGALPDLSGACVPVEAAPDEVVLARLSVLQARLVVDEARKRAYPRVVLTAPGQVELGTGGVSTGVSVGVDTTFLRAGAVRSGIAQAENQLKSAEYALSAAERTSKLSEQALRRQIATYGQKQKMLDRQIVLQTQTRDLYRSQYVELGTREITDLLDAEATLADRQVELVETKLNLAKVRVECALRARQLRDILGLSQGQLYGYPLSYQD